MTSYIFVLFISGMQLAKGVQLINNSFFFVLYGAATVPVFGRVIVPLTCIYTHYKHINLINAVLNSF